MDYERAEEIAETMIRQMGGQHALSLMLGAERFRYGFTETGVWMSFQFKMCSHADSVIVQLNPSDYYDVRFYLGGELAGEFFDVYYEMLIPIFRDFTGLETQIPTIFIRK